MNENEDLRIDAEHPIQASDVGRKYTDANGEHVYTADDIHVGIGAKIVSGFRWLSRAECKARGLDAQHPTQRDEPARKPGEFRVGDRVRVVCAILSCEVEMIGKEYVVTGVSMSGSNVMLFGYPVSMARHQLNLIEPAREGEDASTRKGDGASPAMQGESSQASSPPAPSDYERLADFFRDKRPLPVPFELGRKVEAVARREACPTCKGQPLSFESEHTSDCPECSHPANRAGRGWQEVR